MTSDFFTEGLQADRYLKAIRLVTQFENEIEAILRQFDQQMVDAQPGLFDLSTDLDWRNNRSSSSALAIHRINHEMEGPQAPDDQRQRLNVHLYWMLPTKYNRTDIDGALRVFGYKIKGADQAIDDQVVERTRNGGWSILTSENPFDSNIDFYKHVNSLTEIEAAQEELVRHFTEFGNEYARN